MRKKKSPVLAVFILALCVAIIGFWNIQMSGGSTPGVYSEGGHHEGDGHDHGAEPAQTDEQRKQEMSETLGGPNAPGRTGPIAPPASPQAIPAPQ